MIIYFYSLMFTNWCVNFLNILLFLCVQVYDTIAATDRSFAFNVVFEPEARQEDVFEHSGVKRLIDMALDG